MVMITSLVLPPPPNRRAFPSEPPPAWDGHASQRVAAVILGEEVKAEEIPIPAPVVQN